jgi:Protein of unknown function (DUF2975)
LNIDAQLSYNDKERAARKPASAGGEAVQRIKRSPVAPVLFVVLNAAWYLVAAVLVLTVLLTLAGASVAIQIGPDGALNIDAAHPHVTMAIPVSVRVDDRTRGVSAPALGIEQGELGVLQGTLRFPPRWGAFFVANLVLAICWLALALWVIGLLRSLMGALRAGQPFVAANARRVRSIGWAVVIGEIVRASVVYFENRYAMTHYAAQGLQFMARPDISVFAIGHGLIILALAEVFRAQPGSTKINP